MRQDLGLERSRRVLRLGVAVIAAAGLWRLWTGAGHDPREAAATVLYLTTGRQLQNVAQSPTAPVRPAPTVEATRPGQTQPTVQAQSRPLRLPAQTAPPTLLNTSGKTPDTAALFARPLQWQLRSEQPRVLILHTHATEAYTGSYEQSGQYRTLDSQNNMLRVGAQLQARLAAAGIPAIHDTTLHDHPSYNGSYGNSRKTAQARLEAAPSVELVLDLHRDAVELSDGSQLATTVEVEGVPTAQLMLVVGTDGSGLDHAGWQDNLALALKLQWVLEQLAPGITRPIYLRSERFNQDLRPGALLVEVGAAGNTLPEALAATEVLARAIELLADGAEPG